MHEYFIPALLAGGAAGTAVDLSLFPLDTVKTRLQSQQGFWKAGGFRRIYAGVGPTIVGSAPTAAVFFCCYESTKYLLDGSTNSSAGALSRVHMFAAIMGEVAACLIRVPVELTKQRTQSGKMSSRHVFREILRRESTGVQRQWLYEHPLHALYGGSGTINGFLGLYRGYISTVAREIPFAIIQFPLWEFSKNKIKFGQGGEIQPWQSAVCGSISGAIAAAATTPLDVAKTRIMLADRQSLHAKGNVGIVLQEIWLTKGFKGLFAGIVPRVAWISIGGFIFLGAYDKVKAMLAA